MAPRHAPRACSYGAEITSSTFYKNVNTWDYMINVVQHPYVLGRGVRGGDRAALLFLCESLPPGELSHAAPPTPTPAVTARTPLPPSWPTRRTPALRAPWAPLPGRL